MTFDAMQALFEAVRSWRVGDPVPASLVAFPHHNPDHHCGFCSHGHSVGDYIRDISDPALLDALLLDPRTDDIALVETLRQVLRTRGLVSAAALLAEAMAKRSDLAGRPPVTALASALRAPCVLLKIARYDKDQPVPLTRAREVVESMFRELLAGAVWADALRRGQDALPGDPSEYARLLGLPLALVEQCRGTRLSYAFDGSATPDYRDIIGGRDLRTDQWASVPAGHLETVFEARGGTHLTETGAALWLYHVEEFYAGTDAGRTPR